MQDEGKERELFVHLFKKYIKVFILLTEYNSFGERERERGKERESNILFYFFLLC